MNTYTLKVNIRAQEERERREKERLAREENPNPLVAGPPPRARKRRGLNFVTPGTFVEQGEQLRKKAKLEALAKKVAAKTEKTGTADAAKLAELITNKDEKEEEVPDIEWWDKLLLRNKSLDEVILRLEQKNAKPEEIFDGITNLVEHPPIKKSDEQPPQLPIFLTKKEKKKLRRQSRKNAELEKQEKIRLGLVEKPEPKLKRSNIMYALSDLAAVNPSKADQMVREQEEKRKQAHEAHNESKKLSVEEKRAKKLRKIQEDLSVVGTWVAVYRILNISSQAHRFIITQNAKQLTMTGALIRLQDPAHPTINLVIVEGGPKQQRKFKHLILDRIHWSNDPQVDATNIDTPTVNNKCLLVWEGQVAKRSFPRFEEKTIKLASDVRKFLEQRGIEHYWDLAFSMSILDTIEDT